MKTLNLIQGSDPWRQHRDTARNASEAAAMLGLSAYKTRTQLLTERATGITEEVGPTKQRIFDAGHATEKAAQPMAEEILGEELFPCTATDDEGYLSASFDGLDMMESVCWEHKLWNATLAAAITAGEVPDTHWPQLEQQLAVSGAERVLFMCSDGTRENMAHLFYESVPERRAQLLAGWKQFDRDLESFEYVEPAVVPVGVAPESLPALRIQVTGQVTASNLEVFKDHALAVFAGINTDLVTDSDFADAEKTVKWCGDVESKLAQAKENALAQTASLDDLFRAIDDIKESARTTRLNLEKQVKAKKESRRNEILAGARTAFGDHVAQINATLGGKIQLPAITAEFAGSIKGKRTLSSMQDALDTVLANAKIEANRVADGIRINLETLRADSVGHETLFPDAQTLVLKANDDLKAVISSRITEHQAAEQRRKDQEEQAEKARQEAAEKLEQSRKEEAERAPQAQATAAAPIPEGKPEEPVSAPVVAQPTRAPAANVRVMTFAESLDLWSANNDISAKAFFDLRRLLHHYGKINATEAA